MSTLKSAAVARRRAFKKKKTPFFDRDDLFLLYLFMLPSVLLSAILWTGEIWEFLSFTERYPSIIYNILLFGVTSALGQVRGWTEDARNPAEILHVQLTLFYMSLPDLHFPDCGQLRTSDLLHRHNHKEVLHHPRLGSSVWQLHDPSAVDRHHPGVPR